MQKFLCTLLVLLIANFTISPAITIADEAAMGQQAEQTGKLREALNHYVAALQSAPEGSAKEQQLREKIIKLVQKIQPPPVVPEEAMRHLGRGQAAVEMAKRPEDYDRAIAEFKKAVSFAPWLSDGYYNLGVMQEKAGKFNEAISSFRLYLLAAPSSPDAQKVQTRIYALEYKAEQQREEDKKSKKVLSLSGTWYNRGKTGRYQVSVTGNAIEIVSSQTYFNGQWHNLRNPDIWQGPIQGLTIEGNWSKDFRGWLKNGRIFNRPMKGTISSDGNTIKLKYTAVAPAGITDNFANNWADVENQELELNRDF